MCIHTFHSIACFYVIRIICGYLSSTLKHHALSVIYVSGKFCITYQKITGTGIQYQFLLFQSLLLIIFNRGPSFKSLLLFFFQCKLINLLAIKKTI